MSIIRMLVLFLVVSASARGQVRKTVFNHVAFYVKELKRSTVFYKEIIGLDTIPEPFKDGRHTWFSVGPKAHLHIIEGGNYDPRPKDKSMHFCFSVDDVEAFVRRLERAGIPYEDAGGHGAHVAVVCGGSSMWGGGASAVSWCCLIARCCYRQ